MRLVIQRVTEASVKVDGDVIGNIGKGFMVLWGACEGDSLAEAEKLADKLCKLRVFEDEDEKMNLGLDDIGGEVLIISQFTLYAGCKKGNRPNFIRAMRPEQSEAMYEDFLQMCRERLGENRVKTGSFGADMKVSLVNDGPVTIIMDTEEWK